MLHWQSIVLVRRAAKLAALACLGVLTTSPCLTAAEATEKTSTEVLAADLDDPCGLTVQPGPLPHKLFIAEGGAGRVLRLEAKPDAKPTPAITGFKAGRWRGATGHAVGPLSLTFASSSVLLVGDGGISTGELLVRGYACEKNDAVHTAGKPLFKISEASPPADPTARGTEAHEPVVGKPADAAEIGYFHGMLVRGRMLFVALHNDGPGRVLRADLTNVSTTRLATLVHDTPTTPLLGPSSVASDRWGNVVVGQFGAKPKAADSKIDAKADDKASEKADAVVAFYTNLGGRRLMQFEPGLHDIIGLAYNPATKLLYALDYGATDGTDGGLFRLDSVADGLQSGVKAVKILALERPAALAFADDGTLYIATFGSAKADAKEKTGQVLKIVGLQ